jgi:hypothetical protein
MNQLDANNWLVFGTLIMASGTIIMSIATVASAIFLFKNIGFLQKQIKTQREQIDAMLDLRRKAIAPSLKFYNYENSFDGDGRMHILDVQNKGDTIKAMSPTITKDRGFISSQDFKGIERYILRDDNLVWRFKTTDEDYDIIITIIYADMDDNNYGTVLRLRPNDKDAIEILQPPTLIKN